MLLFTEGFDYLPTTADNTAGRQLLGRLLGGLGWYGSLDMNVTLDGRFGGKCLGYASTTSQVNRYFAIPPVTQGYFGVAIYMAQSTNVTESSLFIPFAVSPYTAFNNAILGNVHASWQTTQFSLDLDQFGNINVWRGYPWANGVPSQDIAPSERLISTYSGAFPRNTWFYLEVGFKTDGTDTFLEVRINTETVISLEDTVIANISVTYPGVYAVDAVGFARAFDSGGGQRIDDIYFCDATGAVNNTYLGNVRVQAIVPDAPGDLTEWTSFNGTMPNWQAASNPNMDDTQYVFNLMANVGNRDLYSLEPLVNTPNIHGVTVKGAYRQDSGGQAFVKNILKTGGSIVEGEAQPTMGSYYFIKDIFEINPISGVGWTYADINTLQIGPKLEDVI